MAFQLMTARIWYLLLFVGKNHAGGEYDPLYFKLN
jgi:hypothetical protein